MSLYSDKAQKNLTAAQILIKQSLPDASVHCSYYAFVQYMLHTLFVKMKINKLQFEADKRNNNDGTHGYAGKLIGIDLAKKDYKEYKWFQKAFPELKKQRESADYSEQTTIKEEAELALNTSNALISTLVRNFK